MHSGRRNCTVSHVQHALACFSPFRYTDRGYAYSYITSFEGLHEGNVVANINESRVRLGFKPQHALACSLQAAATPARQACSVPQHIHTGTHALQWCMANSQAFM